MRPVLSGLAQRFAIFRPPPCFSGRGAGEGRLRATSGPSHGQAGWLSLTHTRLRSSEFVAAHGFIQRPFANQNVLNRQGEYLALGIPSGRIGLFECLDEPSGGLGMRSDACV